MQERCEIERVRARETDREKEKKREIEYEKDENNEYSVTDRIRQQKNNENTTNHYRSVDRRWKSLLLD